MKNNPTKAVIYCTYGADLSLSKSVRARELFREIPYGEKLSRDQSSKSEWSQANLKGQYFALSVGGSVTGIGADYLILDDLIKNQQEAESSALREKVWDYWQYTLRTRLEPGASVVLIMTRWHYDDICSRLLKTGDWDHIKLPMEAEENDPLNREIGEPLWPKRFGKKEVEKIKSEVSQYVWSALYQQSPLLAEGQRFRLDNFRYFSMGDRSYLYHKKQGDQGVFINIEVIKNECTVYQAIDTAGTEKKASDYFCCITYAVTPKKDILVLDVYREKAETTRHQDILRQQLSKWNPKFQAVENKSFGINIIQSAINQGLPIKSLKADVSKWVRSESIAVMYENHKVYHLTGAPWLLELEKELCEFDKGKHDDQVDCMSYAGILVNENRPKMTIGTIGYM